MIAYDTPAQDMPMRKRVLVAVAAAVVFFAAAGALLIQGYHQAFDALGQWQLKSADAGDPEAQVGLGLSYRNGFGVPTDEAKAVELFRKAAEQGSAAGRFRLGESFEKGRGVSRDTSQAVEWYRQAAEQGSPQARGALRRMYVRGQLVPQIDARAGNWWRKFAEDADSEAKAFARLRLSAEGGDADAQTNLGLSYLTGTGTLKDREKAAEWFGRAGEQGYLRAKCLYAALKASDADWGPRSNGARAAETCRAAADAGDADAQRILGMLYATGSGVRKNFVESAAWTRKAAEQGRADAQYDLGYKYEKGEGVPKDKAQACAWNERAAQQGYPDALSSAAMEAMMASLDGDRCQRRGTADATALLNSSIEYSSEDERRLFPNLWASPLNRANPQGRSPGSAGVAVEV
jgi:TPR repeat protein